MPELTDLLVAPCGRFHYTWTCYLRRWARYGTPAQSCGTCICLAGQCDGQTLTISQRILNTIAEARAPSSRCLYALMWKVFVSWCRMKNEDTESCAVSVILSLLQDCLYKGCMPSTLKVYVVAISAFHSYIDHCSVWRHVLVSRFLWGAGRLHPSRPNWVPVWDLSLVLSAVSEPP